MDLFASPATLLPIAAGLSAWILSAWMLSWGMDGSMWLNLAGLAGVLGGLGMLATRLIFGLEEITEKAFRYLNQQKRNEQEAALDALGKRLRRDNDSRTQTYLHNLRALYGSFQADVEQGKIRGSARAVPEKVDKLFRAAVKHLKHSYHLWRAARQMAGDAQQSLLDEREKVIQEVKGTVDHLARSVEQFHTFRVKESESELAKLREELDETMRVARQAEKRVSALGAEKNYDVKEFEVE